MRYKFFTKSHHPGELRHALSYWLYVFVTKYTFSLTAQWFDLHELYYRLLGTEESDRLCVWLTYWIIFLFRWRWTAANWPVLTPAVYISRLRLTSSLTVQGHSRSPTTARSSWGYWPTQSHHYQVLEHHQGQEDVTVTRMIRWRAAETPTTEVYSRTTWHYYCKTETSRYQHVTLQHHCQQQQLKQQTLSHTHTTTTTYDKPQANLLAVVLHCINFQFCYVILFFSVISMAFDRCAIKDYLLTYLLTYTACISRDVLLSPHFQKFLQKILGKKANSENILGKISGKYLRKH